MGASQAKSGQGVTGGELVDLGRGKLRLSVSHRHLLELSPELARGRAAEVTSIDASGNQISDLRWISKFPALEELVLDNNRVRHTTYFPPHPNLHLLSLNNNRIGKQAEVGGLPTGGAFAVERIAKAYPRLRFLSLLRNPGCPSYFNDCTAAEARTFRQVVVSAIPQLKFFDGSVVEDREREKALEDLELGEQVVTREQALTRKQNRRSDRSSQSLSSAPSTVTVVSSAPTSTPCPNCGAALFLSGATPGTKWPCPRCGTFTEVPNPGEEPPGLLRRLSASAGALSRCSGPPPPIPPPPAHSRG